VGSADQLLALDVGTQSVRALLFDPRGALVASGRVPIEPYVSPRPGWAEQDPEVWWAALGEACRRLWAEPAARPDAVAGVALTTQRVTDDLKANARKEAEIIVAEAELRGEKI